jgi:hypothetical protein
MLVDEHPVRIDADLRGRAGENDVHPGAGYDLALVGVFLTGFDARVDLIELKKRNLRIDRNAEMVAVVAAQAEAEHGWLVALAALGKINGRLHRFIAMAREISARAVGTG